MPNAPQLETAATAMRDFNALAGPIINGYAFCNLTMQQATLSRATAWVEANPYEAVFKERLPARTTNRAAALAEAIKIAKVSAAKERAYFQRCHKCIAIRCCSIEKRSRRRILLATT